LASFTPPAAPAVPPRDSAGRELARVRTETDPDKTGRHPSNRVGEGGIGRPAASRSAANRRESGRPARRVGPGAARRRRFPRSIRKATEARQRGLIRVPLRDGPHAASMNGQGPLFGRPARCPGAPPLAVAPASSPAAAMPFAVFRDSLGIKDIRSPTGRIGHVPPQGPHNMINIDFAGKALLRFSSPTNSPRMGRHPPPPARKVGDLLVASTIPLRGAGLRSSLWPTAKRSNHPEPAATRRTEDQRGTLIGLGDTTPPQR